MSPLGGNPVRLLKAAVLRLLWILRLASVRVGFKPRGGVHYVAGQEGWVIDRIGESILRGVAEGYGVRTGMSRAPRWLVGQVVHYGSLWAFLGSLEALRKGRNKVAVTIYHGRKSAGYPELSRAVERFLRNSHRADKVIVSCSIMKERLLKWGVDDSKLVRIPIGVDLSLFRPPGKGERTALRAELGIPQEAFVIGSFQKDGDGWGAGDSPKLIKGPDVFLETIGLLQDRPGLFVCLSGPARGYVKKGLKRLGVEYAHRLFHEPEEVARLYRCLDLYLITSREEGGPQGALEALASGVPLVSTRVGLVPDLVTHGQDGLLAGVEDAAGLAESAAQVRADGTLGARLARNGLKTIKAYDWPLIAARYYKEIYEPLLNEQTRANK